MVQTRKRQRSELNGDGPEMVSLPTHLLLQVALLIGRQEDIQKARAGQDEATHYLDSLREQAGYVQHQTATIQEWLANNKDAFLHRCRNPETSLAQFEEQVTFHDEQALSLERVLASIEEQQVAVEVQVQRLVESSETLRESVTQKIMDVLKVQQVSTLFDSEEFSREELQTERVVEMPTLKLCEQDCEKFMAHYIDVPTGPVNDSLQDGAFLTNFGNAQGEDDVEDEVGLVGDSDVLMADATSSGKTAG